jgi:hypothetical protein
MQNSQDSNNGNLPAPLKKSNLMAMLKLPYSIDIIPVNDADSVDMFKALEHMERLVQFYKSDVLANSSEDALAQLAKDEKEASRLSRKAKINRYYKSDVREKYCSPQQRYPLSASHFEELVPDWVRDIIKNDIKIDYIMLDFCQKHLVGSNKLRELLKIIKQVVSAKSDNPIYEIKEDEAICLNSIEKRSPGARLEFIYICNQLPGIMHVDNRQFVTVKSVKKRGKLIDFWDLSVKDLIADRVEELGLGADAFVECYTSLTTVSPDGWDDDDDIDDVE